MISNIMAHKQHPLGLAEPNLGPAEQQALAEVIDSGWLTMGERVASFERSFAEVQGVANAVAVNSCTAGLHLCLQALGIGPGDEVLVPSVSFVATANAVLYVGATPVFVDIERIDLPHISLADAERKVTAKTAAVIVMHYGGYVMDLVPWRSFCNTCGLQLIEDAAHAPGVEGVGQNSDATAFSFFTNKNMTTAEGGMIVSPHSAVLEKLRLLRSHGMTTSTLDRSRGHAYSYDVVELGCNYRMDELRAALGQVQLARLIERNQRRRELSDLYRRCLAAAQTDNVAMPFSREHVTAAHLLPVLLPDDTIRKQVMAQLRSDAIQSSIHYPPIHQFSFYRQLLPRCELPNTAKSMNR